MFDQDFGGFENQDISVAVIGGGITAAHYSMKLADEGYDITLIVRHPFRVFDFDSDPGWLGPKYLTKFSKTLDYKKRRRLIMNARHRGSFPKDISLKLSKYIQDGRIKVIQDEVNSCHRREEGGCKRY